MEQTLKSIKKEELTHHTEIADEQRQENNTTDKGLPDFSFLVSEKSLANDWLSEEDNRWDGLL